MFSHFVMVIVVITRVVGRLWFVLCVGVLNRVRQKKTKNP